MTGLRLHSSGEGTPILLLHPLGSDRHLWDPVTCLLSGVEVLSCDLPGHGESAQVPGADSVAHAGDQIAALLTARASRPVHVVGFSLGGLVAQYVAANRPELVNRLVLVDTVPIYPAQLRQLWTERAVTARQYGMGPIVEPTLQTWFTPEFLAQNGSRVQAVRTRLSSADPQGYAQACEALASADATDLAAHITAPTLVVCGDQELPAFTAAAAWFGDNLSDARLFWLSRARHAGVLEQPDRFAEALADFLLQRD